MSDFAAPSSTATPVTAPTKKTTRRRALSDPHRVTLQDIARELGLPVMTVSRALSTKRGEVSEKTRFTVAAAAERLGYRPNLIAQAMQTGRTRNIGVVVMPAGDFGSRLFAGIHDTLVASEYLPLVHYHHHEDESVGIRITEQQVLHRLLDRQIDGVILFPYDVPSNNRYIQELTRRRRPLVVLDNFIPGLKTDFVGTDEQIGGRLVAEHLLLLGHRRVGYVAGNQAIPIWAERRQAFERAFRALGGHVSVAETELANPSGYIAATRRLLAAAQRPTALVCAADYYAPSVYTACRMLDARIPEDVSVVGYADLELAGSLHPPLTTVRQDPRAIGAAAARLMIQRCTNGFDTDHPVHLRLKPELVVRASTAGPITPSTQFPTAKSID
jgi:LacI family transcriptional regulator